jgi:hypothetical protein
MSELFISYKRWAGRARAGGDRPVRPEATLDPAVTAFGTLHEALDSVREVIAKYYALISQGIIGRWEAVPQFNTIRPFTRPWVEDPDAVARRSAKRSRDTEADAHAHHRGVGLGGRLDSQRWAAGPTTP